MDKSEVVPVFAGGPEGFPPIGVPVSIGPVSEVVWRWCPVNPEAHTLEECLAHEGERSDGE